MKIRNFEAAAMSRTLAGIELQKAQDVSETVVDLYVALLPAAREYDSALVAFQKDAQGKTLEEAKNLVSAQAFEKIANDSTEVDISLDIDQIKAIGKYLRSVADIALLYNLKQ